MSKIGNDKTVSSQAKRIADAYQKTSRAADEIAKSGKTAEAQKFASVPDQLADAIPSGSVTSIANALGGGKFEQMSRERFLARRARVDTLKSLLVNGAPPGQPMNEQVAGQVQNHLLVQSVRTRDVKDWMQSSRGSQGTEVLAASITALAQGKSAEDLELLANNMEALADKMGKLADAAKTSDRVAPLQIQGLAGTLEIATSALRTLGVAPISRQKQVRDFLLGVSQDST